MLNIHHFDAFNARPEAEGPALRDWQQLSERFERYPDALMFELLNEPHFDDVEGRAAKLAQADGIARRIGSIARLCLH